MQITCENHFENCQNMLKTSVSVLIGCERFVLCWRLKTNYSCICGAAKAYVNRRKLKKESREDQIIFVFVLFISIYFHFNS